MTDLHVGVAHLHVKNFVSVCLDHVGKWQAAGVRVHIGLEFNLHLVGICNIRLEEIRDIKANNQTKKKNTGYS